jgi:hypothetical protein
MSLYCRRLTQNAKTPLPDGPGSWKLFLPSALTIEPNEHVVVDCAILVKATSGDQQFRPIITSNTASLARGLMVNTFCTMSSDPYKVEFVVFNSGKRTASLDEGYHIANLELFITKHLMIKDVDVFPEGEPVFTAGAEIDSLPKNDQVWFKRSYIQDSVGTIDRFMVDVDPHDMEDFISKRDSMIASPEYAAATDQAAYAANWAWMALPDKMRQNVANAFKAFIREKRKEATSTSTPDI